LDSQRHQNNSSTKPTPLEVLARTCIRDHLDQQSPAPLIKLSSLFMCYVARQICVLAAKGESGIESCNLIIRAITDEPQDGPFGFVNLREGFAKIQHWQETNPIPGEAGPNESNMSNLGPDAASSLAGEYDWSSESVLTSRVVFLTENDMLFGMAPKQTQVGDELWVLNGAKAPYMLRRTAVGRYLVVGSVYVYGMMHGEANESIACSQHVILS
jgi:hypothetical protein